MELDTTPRLSSSLAACVVSALTLLSSTAQAAWPTLESSVAEAQRRSEGVVRASSEVEVAKAGQLGARVSKFGNPYLDFQVDRGSTTKDLQVLAYLYTPIEIFGQRGARVDEAKAMTHWRDVGLGDAKSMATGQVIASFGSIAVAAERRAIAERGEQAARAEASYYEGRFAAQDATVYDKSLAQAELSRWLQTKAEAILKLTDAKVQLIRLTGNVAWNEPSTATAPLPPPLRHEWTKGFAAQAVEKSPALRLSRAESTFWEQSKKRWQAERRMPIELTLIGGRGDPGDLRLGGGFLLQFPVFRRYQGDIAKAEANQAYVEQIQPVLRTSLQARLDGAREALFAILEALQNLDQYGIPAGEKAVEASFTMYKSGKIDLLQVLLARRELALAKSRRLDLLESAWRAYADLAALSGDWP